ncbi:hypothetical protein V2W45_1473335 [Cenococcum geophilum]
MALVNAFILGYGLISKFILNAFSFNISIIVLISLILFAIVILFFMLLVFINNKDNMFNSRILKISYLVKAGDDSDNEEALNKKGIFNFRKWAARLPPRYEPYFSKHRFWYNGRLFTFNRDEELIELRYIRQSIKPIKNLLNYIKLWSLKKEKAIIDYGCSARPSRLIDTILLNPKQKTKVVEDINKYLYLSSPR